LLESPVQIIEAVVEPIQIDVVVSEARQQEPDDSSMTSEIS